jgi:hypothetical protein
MVKESIREAHRVKNKLERAAPGAPGARGAGGPPVP